MDSVPVLCTVLASLAGTYHILASKTDQLVAVCHGVSVSALTESPILTATPHIVPATDMYHRSPLRMAPAVPDPPEEGNRFTEASNDPRSSIRPTTSQSAYAFVTASVALVGAGTVTVHVKVGEAIGALSAISADKPEYKLFGALSPLFTPETLCTDKSFAVPLLSI